MDSSSLFLGSLGLLMLFGTIFLMFYRKFSYHQENDITTVSSSSSPPSLLSRNWKHHVFPSFHGADVRKAFLSHILKELKRKGINPFIDNDIERSKEIGPELIEAIRGSRIAIVLLSKNYASSTWCLNELVEIMNCMEEFGQIVMTIFYQVDPSDVKKQAGGFREVFKRTCAGQQKEDIRKWRRALAKVATIAGYHSSNSDNEAVMIEEIATDISNKLNNSTPCSDFSGYVGMEAHMEKMKPLLCLESDEVRMIGIWGPSGIGKSTIARFLFNEYSHKFQLSVFMENIKVGYPRPCYDEYSAKLKLQKEFLSKAFNHNVVIETPHLGVLQERLNDKKVFVVLDDVDKIGQLDALAKETRWFGPGSRVIITTQDQKLLKSHGMINNVYKVDFPSNYESLQIFCMHAFGQNSPKDGYRELSWEVTRLTGNLPLGLKVMGSYFREMTKQEWENALPRLRTKLDGDIESVLKFSYDALSDRDKDLFLHIACFFNYKEREKVEEHLSKKFLDVKEGIRVLAEKSLISISSNIQMHNLLAQMGREIVCQQSVDDPGERRILTDSGEICELLTGDTIGSKTVIGIEFNFYVPEDKLYISESAFERMSNLQFLIINCSHRHRDKVLLSQGLNFLSRKLRLLDWTHFPATCFPPIVNLDALVELNMSYNKLEKLWEGIKPLRNLKWMNLSSSTKLKVLPDLSTATNLEKLDCSFCSSLTMLPESIGNAINVEILVLGNCSSLLEIPSSIGNCIKIKKFDLGGCSKLVELPSSIGNATNLEELNLVKCVRLVKLPLTIGKFTNLKAFNTSGCSSLKELPLPIVYAFMKLDSLDFSGCSSLVDIPSSIGNAINLKHLKFSDCSSLVELPFSIGNLDKLLTLNLERCSKLEILPTDINMQSLRELMLTNCSLLKKFPQVSTNIIQLDISGTAIEEVPSSITLWPRLGILIMSCNEHIKKCPHFLDIITKLRASRESFSFTDLDVKNITNSFHGSENFFSSFEINAEISQSLEKLVLRLGKRSI